MKKPFLLLEEPEKSGFSGIQSGSRLNHAKTSSGTTVTAMLIVIVKAV